MERGWKFLADLKKTDFLDWGLLLAWMGVIFFMSTDTFSAANTSRFLFPALKFLFPVWAPSHFRLVHVMIRKTGHFTEYAVLALLWYRTLQIREKSWSYKAALLAVSLSVLYAMTDEFHQSFVPSRTASYVDVGIDSAGALFSMIALWMVVSKRPSHPPLNSGKNLS